MKSPEDMTDVELIESWKSLHSVVCIYGQCGSSDIQELASLRNELGKRDSVDIDELNKWADQAQLDWSDKEHDQAEFEEIKPK